MYPQELELSAEEEEQRKGVRAKHELENTISILIRQGAMEWAAGGEAAVSVLHNWACEQFLPSRTSVHR
jgi:hypothetical protein